jgi:uncharacterized protein YjbJ (UPF0337 family)
MTLPYKSGRRRKRATGEGDWPYLFIRMEKGRKPMKSSTTDQVKGKLHEIKGDVKTKTGQLTNNPDLEAEGQNEKIAGVIQKKIGQIEKVFEK